MRPHLFYAVYEYGVITAVHHGAQAARAACGGQRNYRSFKTRTEAEEYSAWHNFDHERFRELEDRARRERIALRMAEARSRNLGFNTKG